MGVSCNRVAGHAWSAFVPTFVLIVRLRNYEDTPCGGRGDHTGIIHEDLSFGSIHTGSLFEMGVRKVMWSICR